VLIALLIFPITVYLHSPALAIGGAVQGIVVGSFILFALQFLLSLFVGRAFCGWACAGAGLQDCCAFFVEKRARGGRRNWIKYFIWVPWIATIAYLSLLAGGYRSIDPFYQMENGVSLGDVQSYIVYYVVVGLIFVMALVGGKRAFCHYICWMAPFMVIGRKIRNVVRWPSLHLRADAGKCTECGKCDKGCPMSLDVSGMVAASQMENSECILCGNCVDTCPAGTIGFAFFNRERKR